MLVHTNATQGITPTYSSANRAAAPETTGQPAGEEYQGATLFNDEPMNEQQLRTFARSALLLGAIGLTVAAATAAGVDAGVIAQGSKKAAAAVLGGTITGMVGLTTGLTILSNS